MRINNPYIIDQTKLPGSNSSAPSANQVGEQQRIKQARDSYSQSSKYAQVIDAEYVDCYTPDTKALKQERQNLHLALEAGEITLRQGAETEQKINSSISQYQLPPVEVSLPGTYLNIFA